MKPGALIILVSGAVPAHNIADAARRFWCEPSIGTNITADDLRAERAVRGLLTPAKKRKQPRCMKCARIVAPNQSRCTCGSKRVH